MTPSARVQSAIEILDSIITAAREQGPPADRLIAQWFKDHRFAGSKDKRAIRELVYDAVRACGPVPATGRAAMLGLVHERPELRNLFDGEGYGAKPISDDEAVAEGGIAPEWLEDRLIASDVGEEEARELLSRAPLDLRVNSLKAARDQIDVPVDAERLAAPHGLRVEPGTRVEEWDLYKSGAVEVQDCGSQLACLAVGASAGDTVIDLCAGAGGKTIALAASMANDGTLVAADTDKRRLSQLEPRAERAGAIVADTILLDPGKELEALGAWIGEADRVLIDAPCSGTGTWRRNPEARWRLTPADLERLTALQSRLLAIGAQLVKSGGSMTYVTCSLLDEEGVEQIDRFLAENGNWSAQPLDMPAGQKRGRGVRLTPKSDGTDGFFIARLGRA